MVNKLKYQVARILYRRNLKKRLKQCSSDAFRSRVILLNVPSHGNLGDHLISLAEKQLVKDITGNKPLTFTTADLYYGIDLIERFSNPTDIILITGGGYLGSIWPEEEARVSKLVRDLPRNTIIVMPQTVYYDDDARARKMMEEAAEVYGGNPGFFLTVREKNSLAVARNDLKLQDSKVTLLPDMALYLSFANKDKARQGIILCMRNDKEKAENPEVMAALQENLQGKEVRHLDTQVNRSVSQDDEEQEVFNLIDQFQRAELVITDRLHGMLYATICGTPVIALDNYSHKVKSVYDCWLKDLKHVRFIDNPLTMKEAITELLNNGPGTYSPTTYQNHLRSFFNDKLNV